VIFVNGGWVSLSGTGKTTMAEKDVYAALPQFIVLGLCLLFFGYLSYEIIRPYLSAILWAVILAVVSYPLYSGIRRYVRNESFASLINLIIILLFILGPVSYFMYLLVNEIGEVTAYLQKENVISGESPRGFISRFLDPVLSALGLGHSRLGPALVDYIIKAGQKLAGQIPGHAMAVVSKLLDLILALFLLFLLPQKGPRLVRAGLEQIPLPRGNREKLKELVRDIVISTIYGTIFSAVAHGLLGFIVFWLSDVPSPVLLGVTAGLSALIPLFGSAIVWVGAVVYLLVMNRIVAAVVVLAVAFAGTQAIEQLLRPWLAKGQAKIPFVIVFLGILGGVKLFGFVGFVLGPLVLAIFVALLQFLKTMRSETRPSGDTP